MVLERGSVIRVCLNPTEGREQQGEARPCVVLSNQKFNAARDGLVVIAPITNTVKPEVLSLIAIPTGFKIRGSVIAEQIRTIDLVSRWWRDTGEVLPTDVVDRVVQVFALIIQ